MVKTEWLELGVNQENPENTSMECYLAKPERKGPWPGVLVLMEIFGVNAHMRDVTERIAHEGYVAMSINYYHRTTRNLELGYTEKDIDEGRHHKNLTTKEGLLADVRAALDYLRAQPDVRPKHSFGTIGFCFGGHVAYLAATLPEVTATASYYGGGIAIECPGGGLPTLTYSRDIRGKMLCFFGGKDAMIPYEQVERIETTLQETKVRHTVVCYPDADHGFHCDQRVSYDPEASKDAWDRTMQLFRSELKAPLTIG